MSSGSHQTRGPGGQGTRGPGDQGTRGPEDQGTRGSGCPHRMAMPYCMLQCFPRDNKHSAGQAEAGPGSMIDSHSTEPVCWCVMSLILSFKRSEAQGGTFSGVAAGSAGAVREHTGCFGASAESANLVTGGSQLTSARRCSEYISRQCVS